ncbi:ras family small GTPase [Naegleria gruberi]|uniref:Ras family small GTPase n=1 Tax=Naegleria gruberi TaxID=5762 RepID=D2VD42_NAEGR|nr:ras family small GTPase [Naegleria gruberi]EFC45264.1 ras family small GTPase [Naegleria gruberi]|eukprot:XP_002678008.1 ras family small GTPase [Naegleria gruberi strain NEG-M]
MSKFLQLPQEIHTEIISYLSPFYELAERKLHEQYFHQLKNSIPNVLSFRLIHPNYSKFIAKYIDEFCWIFVGVIFDQYSISVESKEMESLHVFDKFAKIGVVKSLGYFIHLIRTREKQGKIFRKKFDTPIIELLVIGRGGSGKSSIITRFIYGQFFLEYDPTGYDSYKRTISVDDEEETVNFLDTCSEEETDYYWKNCMFDVLILVCSMIDQKSLEELKILISKFVDRKGKNAPCMIAMNKCDLPDRYEINLEMVQEVVKEFELTNCTILKTSAKTNENIDKLVEECVRKFRVRIDDPKKVLEEVLSLHKKKKGCLMV